jgi:hypothetical protein
MVSVAMLTTLGMTISTASTVASRLTSVSAEAFEIVAARTRNSPSPKTEGRRPKEIRNPESREPGVLLVPSRGRVGIAVTTVVPRSGKPPPPGLRTSVFGFLSAFGLRLSDFVKPDFIFLSLMTMFVGALRAVRPTGLDIAASKAQKQWQGVCPNSQLLRPMARA